MIDKTDLQAIFKSSNLKQPEDAVGFLLWRVAHHYQREIDRACAEVDLTHLQFVVLVIAAWLGIQSDPVTQTSLATFSGIHKMQISAVLKALEAKEFVERPRGGRDERVKHVRLTTEGVAILYEALPLVDAAQTRFFGSNERIGTDLHKALRQMAELNT